MKKDYTLKEIEEIVSKIVSEEKNLKEDKFSKSLSEMNLAEQKLVATLNEQQLELYKIFCEKRKIFYTVADELLFT